MRTDRELLELAAKAAGVGPLDFDYAEREGHWFYSGPRLPMPQGIVMAASWTYWDPLDDDGESLRLAVKLDLLAAPRMQHERDVLMFTKSVERLEATRRAIVLTAAEIGASMP